MKRTVAKAQHAGSDENRRIIFTWRETEKDIGDVLIDWVKRNSLEGGVVSDIPGWNGSNYRRMYFQNDSTGLTTACDVIFGPVNFEERPSGDFEDPRSYVGQKETYRRKIMIRAMPNPGVLPRQLLVVKPLLLAFAEMRYELEKPKDPK